MDEYRVLAVAQAGNASAATKEVSMYIGLGTALIIIILLLILL